MSSVKLPQVMFPSKNPDGLFKTVWDLVKWTKIFSTSGYQKESEKGVAGGYAGLDSKIRVPTPQAGVPVGMVAYFKNVPTGWLECLGQAVSRTIYADLFTEWSTTFGAGDGTTTFNLANIQSKVIVGQAAGDAQFDGIGETGGAKTHTLVNAELPVHMGTDFQVIDTVALQMDCIAGSTVRNIAYTAAGAGNALTLRNIGGGGAHNNLQPYIVFKACVFAGA